ncbi:unnamed protein product, partial [marine sediment metagenome]
IVFFRTEQDLVSIPFTFARTLLKVEPNVNIPFPTVPIKFTKDLWESQRPIAGEAMKHLLEHRTTTLNVFTASGKTVVCAYLAAELSSLQSNGLIL